MFSPCCQHKIRLVYLTQHSIEWVDGLSTISNIIERFYISETPSFGRKMSRRNPVLLLGFSCSVADYEETKGFWQNFFLYQTDYEGLSYLLNDFKSLPTFFQWFMALSSWKIGVVFVLHTLQGKEVSCVCASLLVVLQSYIDDLIVQIFDQNRSSSNKFDFSPDSN